MSSAITTHMSQRLLLTMLMFIFIGFLYLLMRRGWLRQQRAQSFVIAPQRVGDSEPKFFGIYASTTFANQPLKRVTVHGLGTRSKVGIAVGPHSIDFHRLGAASFSIPKDDLIGVSRASGIAGKVVGTQRLILLTWRLGEEEVDTGILVGEREEDLMTELVGS